MPSWRISSARTERRLLPRINQSTSNLVMLGDASFHGGLAGGEHIALSPSQASTASPIEATTTADHCGLPNELKRVYGLSAHSGTWSGLMPWDFQLLVEAHLGCEVAGAHALKDCQATQPKRKEQEQCAGDALSKLEPDGC